MYEFTIIIKGNKQSIDVINTLNSICNSFKSNVNKRYFVYFEVQKYQLSDEVIEKIQVIQNNNFQFYFGKHTLNILEKISNDNNNIIFFMEVGDTFEEKYLDYLCYFFDENKDKCQVVLPDFFNFKENNDIFYFENISDFSFCNSGLALLSSAINNFENKYCDDVVIDIVLNSFNSYYCVGLINSNKYIKITENEFKKISLFKIDNTIEFKLNREILEDVEVQELESTIEDNIYENVDDSFCHTVSISCIVSAYDENFVNTLNSIELQSLELEENIQVIIIGNGKNSIKKLIKKYSKKYLYFEDEMIFVARNIAINNAMGNYLMFFNSGDILDKDYFKESIELLNENENINIAINEFGYKNKIINITENCTNIFNSLSNIVFRKTVLDNLRFNENNLFFSESEFLHNVMIENNKIIFFENFTAYKINNYNGNYNYFEFESFCESIITSSLNKFGVVTKYTQNIIINILKKEFTKKSMILKECNLHLILQNIYDDIIQNLSNDLIFLKIFLFKTKYNNLVWKNSKSLFYLIFEEKNLLTFKPKFKIINIENKGNTIDFKGYIDLPYYDNVNFNVNYCDICYEINLTEKSIEYFLNSKIHSKMEFSFTIPYKENSSIDFYLDLNSNVNLNVDICEFFDMPFIITQDYIIKKGNNKNQLLIEGINEFNLNQYSNEYIATLDDKVHSSEIALIQRYLRLYPIFSKYKIWLFIKTEDFEYDNVETYFDYCSEYTKDKIDKYLVKYEATDEDIERGSELHQLMYLFAKKIIVSQMSENSLNPFGKNKKKVLEPFIRNKIICLPNEFNINESTIEDEYKSNLGLISVSSKKEVIKNLPTKIIGRPRFDLLENDNQKIILIMPSYKNKDKKFYDINFKNSKYCIYLNELLSNEKLEQAATLYGYALVFYPHHNTLNNLSDYKTNSSMLLLPKDTPIDAVVAQSSLLVTDYNDISFDFAYLKKPVLYYHFDEKKVQTSFDYKKNGFGEVLADCDKLVETIIQYMKDNCTMKSKYLKKTDSYFKFFDGENCDRLYNLMLENDR
ncbi:MAG: CDP-glycerol glycerophosphotransferase family protein [Lachnospirales bacterium]